MPRHGPPPTLSDPAASTPPPSKTRRKLEMHARQALGERIAELPANRLDALALPEELHGAILDYRRFTKWEAKRRQMQYIGRLMREIDVAPIEQQLDACGRTTRDAVAGFHDTEAWRDRLLADDDALDRFCAEHPEAERRALADLVGKARAERASGRPPASARLLFRALARVLGDAQARDR
jgi:ribosome-associated protein